MRLRAFSIPFVSSTILCVAYVACLMFEPLCVMRFRSLILCCVLLVAGCDRPARSPDVVANTPLELTARERYERFVAELGTVPIDQLPIYFSGHLIQLQNADNAVTIAGTSAILLRRYEVAPETMYRAMTEDTRWLSAHHFPDELAVAMLEKLAEDEVLVEWAEGLESEEQRSLLRVGSWVYRRSRAVDLPGETEDEASTALSPSERFLAVAESSPAQALSTLYSMTTEEIYDLARIPRNQSALRDAARSDPQKFLSLLLQRADVADSSTARDLSSVLRYAKLSSDTSLIAMIVDSSSRHVRRRFSEVLFTNWSLEDPERAWDVFNEYADQIGSQAYLAGQIFKPWIRNDPLGAVPVMLQSDYADSLNVAGLLSEWSRNHPEQAEQAVRAYIAYVQDKPSRWVERLPGHDNVLSAWVGRDPAGAVSFIRGFERGPLRDHSIQMSVRAVSDDNLSLLSSLAVGFESTLARERALGYISERLVTQPELLVEFVKGIPESSIRAEMAMKAIRKATFADPNTMAELYPWWATGGYKSSFLSSLMENYVDLDLEGAIRWTDSLSEHEQLRVNSILIQKMSEEGLLDEAVARLSLIPPSKVDPSASNYIVREWVKRDVDQAFTWASGLSDPEQWAQAMRGFIYQLMETDPVEAGAWLTDSEVSDNAYGHFAHGASSHYRREGDFLLSALWALRMSDSGEARWYINSARRRMEAYTSETRQRLESIEGIDDEERQLLIERLNL